MHVEDYSQSCISISNLSKKSHMVSLCASTSKARELAFSLEISSGLYYFMLNIFAMFPSPDDPFLSTVTRQSKSFFNVDVVCDVAKNLQAMREVFLHRLHPGRHVAT